MDSRAGAFAIPIAEIVQSVEETITKKPAQRSDASREQTRKDELPHSVADQRTARLSH